MALTRSKKEFRLVIRKRIEDHLYTTAWGKYYARPSQVRAAAKNMQLANRFPYQVAKALGLKEAA